MTLVLADPEQGWTAPPRGDLDLAAAVETRLGRIDAPVSLLSGGQANLNVLVGGERVLRIYERDPTAREKESALLGRTWRNLRVPRVLDGGEDWLLLERMELRPLRGSALQGGSVGAAAAEIHGLVFEASGFLDGSLTVGEPLPDARSWLRGRVAELGPDWDRLEGRILELWSEVGSAVDDAGPAVLNHGDFKLSNLFVGPADEVVVLDWEFAFAGPALMDVGQLFRWIRSDGFRSGFERGYRENGGRLPVDWERRAAVLDLVNLVGLALPEHLDVRRHADLMARTSATLGVDTGPGARGPGAADRGGASTRP